MRKPVCFLLGLTLMSQLFFACKKDDEKVTPPSSQAGYFVISSIDQSSIANGRKSAETHDSEFDLGALLSSDKFLFLIANGGDEPIFNITLSSDNTPFEITPKSIQLVPGTKGSAIIPLLTVGVTHGIRIKGIGTAPNLPKGENKATIRMTGKTLSGKDTIDVIGEFIVKVDAQVVDAKVLSGGINAVKDSTDSFVIKPAKTVQLMNSGSVPIRATISYSRARIYLSGPDKGYPFGHPYQYKNELELLPNEAKDITQMISPIQHYEEDGYDFTDYYYDGFSYIEIKPVKEEGVVVNLTGLRLVSK
jgi:hypothetical protein